DANFDFPGIPATITHAIAFAVFTHLPLTHLTHALTQIRARFPALQSLIFTTFLAAPDAYDHPLRQPDGVVTHPTRAPYHHRADQVLATAAGAGFHATLTDPTLPRGQRLCTAIPS
ncbi:MAG: class I SAM-dependent methyltransferase, partial [Pseudorhodobacter sp.]|nr:class I SAM-dependent methyltransferase [Pseudorhodobacter sp.]